MIPYRKCLPLFLLFFLVSCSMIPSLAKEKPASQQTPIKCGCDETGVPTLAGGLAPAGPAGPSGFSGSTTETPASQSTNQAEWASYTNPTYGFSFQYPAVYNDGNLSTCAVRDNPNLPKGAVYQLALGARTSLTLYKTAQSLQEAVTVFQADPSSKDFTFDAPKERTVGGVPALVLPYRSGGTNRYAEAVFFVQNGTLYRVDAGTGPSACDVPAANLRELDAYSHLLDSFQFGK